MRDEVADSFCSSLGAGCWLLAVFPRPEASGASSPVAKRTSEKEPSAADRRNKVAQTDGLFLIQGETVLAILSALPQRRFHYPVEGEEGEGE